MDQVLIDNRVLCQCQTKELGLGNEDIDWPHRATYQIRYSKSLSISIELSLPHYRSCLAHIRLPYVRHPCCCRTRPFFTCV